MTYKDALKIINDTPVILGYNSSCSVREYYEMLHLAEATISKQIPKKPKVDGWLYCPICGKDVGIEQPNFCSICGQALDWGGIE